MRKRVSLLLWVALGAALPAGCGRAVVKTENPVPVAAGEYDRVFDAAVAELRQQKFIVDRQDRRFGVITTRPLIASTFFEPWYTDNTTGRQVLESTLNLDRRTVRVRLSPAEEIDPASTVPPTRYLLGVEVASDRRQRPPRQLTTSALGTSSLSERSRYERRIVTERGTEEGYWKPLGRDAFLEQRLVDAILTRAGEAGVNDEPQAAAVPAHAEP